MPLDLRPNCECRHRKLPNGDRAARTGAFKCTLCTDCVSLHLGSASPDYGSDLVLHPSRPARLPVRRPPSARRSIGDHAGCAG